MEKETYELSILLEETKQPESASLLNSIQSKFSIIEDNFIALKTLIDAPDDAVSVLNTSTYNFDFNAIAYEFIYLRDYLCSFLTSEPYNYDQ